MSKKDTLVVIATKDSDGVDIITFTKGDSVLTVTTQEFLNAMEQLYAKVLITTKCEEVTYDK